jgi:hypothetical protein
MVADCMSATSMVADRMSATSMVADRMSATSMVADRMSATRRRCDHYNLPPRLTALASQTCKTNMPPGIFSHFTCTYVVFRI